jgi:hypothetical protein
MPLLLAGVAFAQAPAIAPGVRPGGTPGPVMIPGSASNPGYAPGGASPPYTPIAGYTVPGVSPVRPPQSTGSDEDVLTEPPPSAGVPTVPPTPLPYIAYEQPYCCGPVGANGPIRMELYLRAGTSSPVGGTSMARALGVGSQLQFGGRTLFFNLDHSAAWTIELGIGNAYNHETNSTIPFDLFGKPVNIRSVNRTWGTIGIGREHYILHLDNLLPWRCPEGESWTWDTNCKGCGGCGACSGLSLRIGYDVGFRYGTVRIDNFDPSQFTDYSRVNSRMYTPYIAIHSDIEIPRGCCTFLFGSRLETEYNVIDKYGSMSDFAAINFLITTGVRY